MPNIKDLFKTFQAQKAYVSKSLNDLAPGVESANFTDSTIILRNEVEPYVDFSDPANFVFYGSAEQYYRDAFSYIGNEFPYDGSGNEKTKWEATASTFDKYIFEKVYPRRNGYVRIGKDATALTFPTDGYSTPSRTEFIYFEGGPHPAPQVQEGAPVSEFFPTVQGATPGANYYNETINQQSNLEIDGERGISLEFWINKSGVNAGIESERQIVCDIWNNGSWGNSDYGRFRVEISGTATGLMEPNFHVEFLSGTSGYSSGQIADTNPTIILSGSSLTGSWNHFALTFENTGSRMAGNLYQNGKLVYSLITGSNIGLISGPINGQIGSLITEVSGAQGARGFGLLSASLDEFRFWKIKRTAQQIGLNWFTQINGGTNSDFKYDYNTPTKYSFTNPVDLGIYYKFNEGITQIRTTDAKILDYSGRLSNGSWTGYGTVENQRSIDSAIVEAGASPFEFKDPILYSYNPSVATKLETLVQEGFNYDINNNASIYQSLPGWIRDEDVINDRKILLKLIQVMASYFDRLQLQIQSLPRIRDINYISSSFKPFPFVDRLIDSTGLTSTELFTEAKAIEDLVSRDDFRLFSKKLDDTKNRIYQNIYNNLVYILKSKGTEKSFRNLIRCYGVGEELIKLNLYGDQVTYAIKENFVSTITRKRFANFNTTASFNASVHQSTGSTASPNKRSFLLSSELASTQGNTFEIEAFFPRRQQDSITNNFYIQFQTGSLFGVHTADPSDESDFTWLTPDVGNFQVSVVRAGLGDKDAFFVLTGSAGGSFPRLTSSIQKNVYNNTKWNLAVRIKPSSYPWTDAVIGSEPTTYNVEFLGYDTTLDVIENQFKVSGEIAFADGSNFLTSSKRVFIGAHRENFTGSVLQQSDARISSVKYWYDYLDDKTILAHAKDPSNFGRYHPGQNTFLNQDGNNFGQEVTAVPQIETLALQWNFDLVTTSDGAGEFIVDDYSGGSINSTASYGWLSRITELQHPGKGIDFPSNDPDVAIREYVYTAKQQPPEVLNSSDMVNIKTEGDLEVFTSDTRPIRYVFTVEKSMSAIVSSEIIKLFATVMDFNNLIGDPVNRYRQDYKALEKMRELFFRRVENDTLDFEKFIDYYKWIDDSLTNLLTQLFPISANFKNRLLTMIESHVLERNKYWSKFPTLEIQPRHPSAGLYGINEMLYPYRRGGAPVPLAQDEHCVWAYERAERRTFSSGDPIVDAERDTFRDANDWRPLDNPPTLTDIAGVLPVQYEGSTFALRNFTKPYRFKVDEMPVLKGGSNVARIKNVQYAHAELPFGTTTQLKVLPSSIESDIDCNDVVNPNDKVKLRYKLINNPISYQSGRGDIFAPFSLYSSSVNTGYATAISSGFRPNTDITNYHDDFYGDDKEISAQGPFTEKYVGGREYRHVPFWTPPSSRPEAWNLNLNAESFKSFQFSNSDEYVAIPSGSTLPVGPSADFSIQAWVHGNGAVPYDTIATRQNGGWNEGWGLNIFNTSAEIQFWVGKWGMGAEGGATASWTDGEWHHLVGTYNQAADEVYLYVDNVQSTLGRRNSISTDDNISEMQIGSQEPPGWDSEAYMNNVALFNKTLSSTEVATLFNSGCPSNLTGFSGITNWWKLGVGDTFPVANDSIGDLNGAMTNMLASDIIATSSCPDVPPSLTLTARTINQPRSTLLREPLAKRPVNIRNIRQTTGSTIIGNYSHDYEIIQTSARTLNNRFLTKNNGFEPEYQLSDYIDGATGFKLPDYSKYGSNDFIFVERFSAPGGPEINARGALDLYAEEYAVRNELNQRNSMVRNALTDWQTDHCGQFGIVSVPDAPQGCIENCYRQPRFENYDTLANYHKVHRNAASRGKYKSDYSREVEWVNLVGTSLDNFNRTVSSSVSAGGFATHYAESNQIIETTGYFEIEVGEVDEAWAIGISSDFRKADTAVPIFWDFSFYHIGGGIVRIYEGTNNLGAITPTVAVGDKLRIFRNKWAINYQYLALGSANWSTLLSSPTQPNGTYYPRIAFSGLPNEFLLHGRISNPRYDNWFIQHPIPQDRLQYAWINNSYDKSVDQPFGFLGSPNDGKTNFSVPQGSTSIKAPEVTFISSSNFEFPGVVDGQDYPVNFANMVSLLPGTVIDQYKYTVNEYQSDWKIFSCSLISNDRTVIRKANYFAFDDDDFCTGHGFGSKLIGDSAVEFEIAPSFGTVGSRSKQSTVDLAWITVSITDRPSRPLYPGSIPLGGGSNYSLTIYGSGRQPESTSEFIINLFRQPIVAEYAPELPTQYWAPFSAGSYLVDNALSSDPQKFWWQMGEKFRLVKSGDTVKYQRDFRTKKFTTFYTSTRPLNTLGDVSGSINGYRDTRESFVEFWMNGATIKNLKVINPQNTLLPGNGFVSSSNISQQLNSHLNNLNGPYGYPSWKQIRTGENPVPRFQKKNNILTIAPDDTQDSQLQVRTAPDFGISSINISSEKIIGRFVEPMVTFKYRPLESALVTGRDGRGPTSPVLDLRSRIQHTFCNNLYFFANTSSILNDAFGLKHLFRGHPSYVNPAKSDLQMQDVFYNQYKSKPNNFDEIIYSEVIYPREVNTGLNKTRSRVNYKEDAPMSGSFALPDYGSNGIDRTSARRRTFWSNKW